DMLERFIILLPVGFDRFDYLGNPQLEPEANHQADLTLEYTHPDYGGVMLNGFYAYITDFITGKRLAPAEQVPLTADVLGVKQFYNASSAVLKGVEFAYQTPASLPFKIHLSAAYTHGTVEEATAYVKNANGQITGETTISDDAMPEIPPLEANLSINWPLFGGQLVPRAALRLVSAQDHLSAAYEEDKTPGFQLLDIGVNYKFNEYVTVTGGINNLFDVAYYEHLNRRMISSKGNLYEPGRIFFINLVLDI
ncbi:MAG: TonB-dependent receptor, partial [Bacteroidales bacterium]|nr:TonB-dependent receptor [Bacteroidales bacterium]